jgi:hypothetical protein
MPTIAVVDINVCLWIMLMIPVGVVDFFTSPISLGYGLDDRGFEFQ